MYQYTICDQPDKEIFVKQCTALEKHIPGLCLKEYLHDVDDSEIKIYELNNQTIEVRNTYYLGGVFIDSEIQLEPFFK